MLRKFAVPILIVGALLLVGSAALVVAGTMPPGAESPARAVLPQQSDPEPIEIVDPPTPALVLKVGEATPISIEGSVDMGSGADTKPGPKNSAGSQVKGGENAVVRSESQVRSDSPGPVAKSATSDGETGGAGTVHTWHDGDREMRAVLQNDATNPDAESGVKGAVGSTIKNAVEQSKNKGGGSSVLPEFRSESGGGMMKLPGGVILLLDESLDDAAVDDFFTRNDISKKNVTEIGYLDNAFLVETDAGFPSLNLANELAGQEGVVSSSPNWQRERVAK